MTRPFVGAGGEGAGREERREEEVEFEELEGGAVR